MLTRRWSHAHCQSPAGSAQSAPGLHAIRGADGQWAEFGQARFAASNSASKLSPPKTGREPDRALIRWTRKGLGHSAQVQQGRSEATEGGFGFQIGDEDIALLAWSCPAKQPAVVSQDMV